MRDSPHNVFGRPIDAELARKTRVSISHQRADKNLARSVAHGFEMRGVYYYFDEDDADLQEAAARGESAAGQVVHAIEKGLAHSTHLLAILSPNTMGSWWVPYEIGSARARGYETVTLVSAMPASLPEYIRICKTFRANEELFEWAAALGGEPGPSSGPPASLE